MRRDMSQEAAPITTKSTMVFVVIAIVFRNLNSKVDRDE